MTMAMLPGPYRIRAYRVTGHFRLTNKTPAATYRAPGRYEGSFVRERLIDAVADRLGLDRVAVRRRNLIGAAEMPFSRPLNALGTEIVYDSGDYELLLDKALARIGWEKLQAELEGRRAAGELVGAGIGIFVDKGGIVVRRDHPEGPSIALGEIARHLAPDSPLLGERDPGLSAEGWFRADHMTYPYGVQIAVVRVDRDTGQVVVERYLIAYDIGRS